MEAAAAIVFSTWYGGGRTRATMVRPPADGDRERWRADLERIRETGLDARCWVDWASGEPTRGRYDFRNLELLLELAGEVGVGVFVQVYLDSAPDWVGRDHPDARYVSGGGVAVDSQGSPGYCYDHPAVREHAGAFLTELARKLAPSQVFRGWDLWSEPHVVQWSYFDYLPPDQLFCYCPHTVARFQGWLRGRYGSLEELNTAWYRGFADWGEVAPPRFTTLMTTTPTFDWLRFLMDKLAEDLRWRHDTVRAVDGHVTSSHSAIPSLVTLPTNNHGSPDDWKMPASVDVFGTSLYPKHAGAAETHDPAFRSAMLTGIRSACGERPYWLGELQGGHGYVGTFAAPVTGEDVRSYAWQCVAHGAKGLHFYAWYPMTSGIESGGFGLAHLDGSPSDRSEAAGEVARLVRANAGLLGPARPLPAEAAVLWNVHANTLWSAMRERWHYVPSRSYVGAYRALYADRVPVDFVHADELEAGLPARHRVLYVPFGLALTGQAADALAAFVRGGGVALAEARTAWADEQGVSGEAIPAHGLAAVFGARERDAERVEEDARVVMRVVAEHPLLPSLRKGDTVTGAVFRQRLEVVAEDAEVLAVHEDGSPAIVARREGDGWAVLAGSLLSLAVHRLHDPGARQLLTGLAAAAGVRPPATVEPAEAPVEPRLLTSGKDLLLIALHHGTEPSEVTLEVPAPTSPCQMLDLATGAELPTTATGSGRARLAHRFPPGSVLVARITGAAAGGG